MTYRGRVKGGVVVLKEGGVLAEGTEVRVEPVEDRPLVGLADLAETFPGDPDWPSDGAAEHGHYLYGTPKRGS